MRIGPLGLIAALTASFLTAIEQNANVPQPMKAGVAANGAQQGLQSRSGLWWQPAGDRATSVCPGRTG